MGLSGWGGSTNIINEALERKKQEEERKKAELRAALENMRPQPAPAPLPNPWQAPVFGAPQSPIAVAPAQPQPSPYENPYAVDTGPSQFSSSNDRGSDTVQSRLPQQPMQPVSSVAPRPMMQSLSDRLRDPYNAPNRPMLPTQAQGPAAQNPWQSPTFGQTDVPRYQLQSDEPYGVNRQQIMNAQPEPIQNRIGQGLQQAGQAIGQGVGAVADWWTQQPAFQMAQERYKERSEQAPPSVMESAASGFANAGGATNPMLSIPGAALGAGFGALANTNWGQQAGNAGLAAVDHIFDVPQHAITDTPIPGVNTSIAEFLTPTVVGATKAMGNLGNFVDPTSMANTNANLLDWLSVYTGQQISKAQGVRKQAQDYVKQGQPQANLALYNMSSGADAVASTLDVLVNRDQKVARLQQQGIDAQNSGDAVLAGEYFRQAQRLQEMSSTEMVDEYTNPLASIAYGIVFDPTNFAGPLSGLLGLSPEASALRKAGKVLNVSDAEAIARLEKAGQQGKALTGAVIQGPKDAQKLYRDIMAPFQGIGERVVDATKLLARTPESKAALDTEQLWQGLTGILSGITNKQDAKIVIDTLLTEPGKLVKGIGNLSQEAMQRLAQSDGFAKWGAGLVGNNDFVRRIPILGTVRDELGTMRSLSGEGLVNPYEFYAELHGIVNDAARRANGGKLPTKLPFGADKVDILRLGPDSAVVTYLNGKGEVIQRGVETGIAEAQRRVNEINKALKNAGKKGVIDYARIPADIQRAIMSDVWLGMRPANWMGNALGATTNLFANDSYTLVPISRAQDYLGKKFGGFMPNQRLQDIINPELDLVRNAKTETSSGAIDKLAATLTRNPDNPVSRGMKKLYDIPYGSTEIKLPGGLAIPFGEEAFYTRAFYVPFQRTFNAGITEAINKNLVPTLQQIEGMTPQAIQQVGDWVTSLAQNGSKSDVAQGIRKLVGKPEVKMTLKDLGVPPELLTPQSARMIEQLISDATPSQAGQVMREISNVLAKERNPAASVLNLSPTQPGIYDWTDNDLAQETAWLADNLVRDAKKAGVDVAQATQQATELAKDYLQDQSNTFKRVLQDLSGLPNTPDTWSVTMDFWQEVQGAKNRARSVVDELGKRAAELGTPEAWTQKWEGTKSVYEGLRSHLSELGDNARLSLQDVVNGGVYQPKHDWWDTVSGYIAWDEEAFQQSRTIQLGSPDAADAAKWQEVISKNREYIDNSVYELFGSFQRYPSLENFDIVRHGMQKLEAMGAQVRYNLDQMLDKLVVGEMSKEAYARARNEAWTNYFDAGVYYNSQLGKAIVRNGVLADAGVDLKWTHDGIEFQLARESSTPNKFWARDLSTGEEIELTAAQTADELTPFTVPKNVVDDYNRLTGNEKAIDTATNAVMQEIADSAPPVIRPQAEPTTQDIRVVQPDNADMIDAPVVDTPQRPMMRLGERLPGQYANEATFPRPAYPNAGLGEDQLWRTSERAALPRVQDQPRPAYPNAGLDPWADSMFADTGEDLPLVSGAAQRAPDQGAFVPQDATRTESMFDMRPQMGNAEGNYAPKVQAAEDASPSKVIFGKPNKVDGRKEILVRQQHEGSDVSDIADVTIREQEKGSNVFSVESDDGAFNERGLSLAEAKKAATTYLQKGEDIPPALKASRSGKAPKPTSVGDIAKADAQGATEAQRSMKAEWDRVASVELGLPPIDSLVRRFKRDGALNLNLDKGEVKLFEDLYGSTIAGMPIDNLDDVERFLRTYNGLGGQAGDAQKAIAKSKQFAKMSAQEVVQETRAELVAAGYSDAEIKELAKDRRGLLDTVATIRGEDPDEFGLVSYDYNVPSVAQLMGFETPEEVAGNSLRDWIFRSRKTGNNTATQVGSVAEQTIRSLNDLERTLKARLPEILAGTPNQLTGAQRLRVVDSVLDWLPEYDNQLTKAQKVGDSMANWMMLNYQDRRNMDTVMSLLTPYHYFWSRMPSRVAMAALSKPGLVNLYYEMNRSVELENEQSDLPDRLSGTLPNPLAASGFGNARINVMSPLRYAIPAMSYLQPNPFAAEDSPDDNSAQRWAKQYEKWGPGLNIYVQALLDASDGKMDNYYGDVLNSMIPIPGTGIPVSTAYQRFTGQMPAKDGIMSKFGFGPDTGDDGFGIDAYRARRAISYIGVEEKLDTSLVDAAQQIIVNQYNGDPVEKDVDPAYLQDALELANRGVTRAADDRIVARNSAYNTMMSVSPYPQAEVDMRNAQQQRNAAGYDPVLNPDGSKELQNNIIDAVPGLPAWWSKSSDTPGVDGQLNSLYDEKSRISAEQKKAEEDAVRALNLTTATSGDIYDARAAAREPFQKKKDAIDARIDKLKGQQTPYQSEPTKGMNPQEVSTSFANSVMWQATQVPGKPEYPGDNATSQQWAAYNKQRAAYDKAQEDFIVNALTQVPTSDVVRDRRGPVEYTKNQAVELWWNFNHNRELPEERARLEQLQRQQDDRNAANTAQMQSAKQRVKGGDKLLQEYLATPAGAERDALKEKDWRYRAATLAAYDTATFDALQQKFGEEGMRQYYEAMGKKPEWPGDNATEAELQAYYKASNEFDAKYPQRDEVSLWLNGRYTYADANSTSGGGYDKGADYEQAISTFGPRIFEIERNFNEASIKGTWSEYRNAHQADYALLIGYGEWKKGGQELPQGMGDLPTARWGMNPATQNASYATDADRNAFPNGRGPQQGAPQWQQPFNQGNLPFMPTMAVGNQGVAQNPLGGNGSFQPKSPTLGGGQLAGINAPVNADAPRTAQQWANQNAKYVEGARIGAEIQARRGEVGAVWGDEALAQWDTFFALPKDSAARQAYKDANPVVRAMLLTAYNPTQYQQALSDGFTNEDILAWAGRPPYEGDGSARSAYWDSNPNGWRFNAYLNGRPQAYDPKSDNEDFTYNWGADYNQAKELFGANIWDVVMMQRSLPDDKAARAQFYQANPQYPAWADWWYSNLPDNGYVSAASSYGRTYSYGGGYGGGGGGGGGSVSRGFPPQINPRYMDRGLWESPMQQRQWLPYSQPTPDWLRAGDRLQPDPIRKWTPPRI